MKEHEAARAGVANKRAMLANARLATSLKTLQNVTMKWIALMTMLASSAFLIAADDLPIDFVRQIKPIFADRCVMCHNSETLHGELSLQSRELAMKKRKNGPVIVPNEPDKSSLYLTLILPVSDSKAMPATAHRIPTDEIKAVRRWIEEGAHWPEGKDGNIPHTITKPKID